MESRFINRYRTFCRSLKNLEKSLNADVRADFVLEGTVLNFNLTFDIAWKVMKDILVKETLQQAFANGIIDDDSWMKMLRVRNQLAYDYDGTLAEEQFQNIIRVYYPLFEKLKENARKYYR